jgi:single-strand DNA-binding protein
MGRIVNDPELKYTKSQKPVTSFRIAVDAGYADQSGQRQSHFFDVVAWDGTAQFIATWFGKGQMIAISGKLTTRSWTDKHEQKRVSVEIVAHNVYFCGERKTAAGTYGMDGGAGAAPSSVTEDGGDTFHQGKAEQARFDFRNDFRPMEDDEDVPF